MKRFILPGLLFCFVGLFVGVHCAVLLAETPAPKSQRLINAQITTMKAEVERTRARLNKLESQLAELEAQVLPSGESRVVGSPFSTPASTAPMLVNAAPDAATSPAKLITIEEALNELPKDLWPTEGEFSQVTKKRQDWINKRVAGKTFFHRAPLYDVEEKEASFSQTKIKAVWSEKDITVILNKGDNWSSSFALSAKELAALAGMKRGDLIEMTVKASGGAESAVYVTSPRLLLNAKAPTLPPPTNDTVSAPATTSRRSR